MVANTRGAGWLLAGAMASFAIAALHVAMVPIGEPAYVYFTAPERMVALARAGSRIPALITFGLAAGFAGFGACALAGARSVDRPGLRILLVGVTGIYLLRGSLIVPDGLVVVYAGYPPRIMVFSAIAFIVGVTHLVGLARAWDRLGPRLARH